MNEALLNIDETAARGAGRTDFLADRANDRNAGSREPAWAAVGSMALGVFALVTAEFLPASLLTPIAADFGISEGAAGQTVTATAAFGLLSSLLVTAVIRNLDRRIVMLGFTILLLISNLIAAFAVNLPMLLIARVLLGAALGGFWTMSAALAMRLVPEASVPRALSIIFSGVSAATIFAAPVGIYLGHLFGWRAVFLMATGLSAITLIAQAATLPRMPAAGSARLGTSSRS
jgi:predicted MFS family arabinose efflux permease